MIKRCVCIRKQEIINIFSSKLYSLFPWSKVVITLKENANILITFGNCLIEFIRRLCTLLIGSFAFVKSFCFCGLKSLALMVYCVCCWVALAPIAFNFPTTVGYFIITRA